MVDALFSVIESLADLSQSGLMAFHKSMKEQRGIDLDAYQQWVFESLPPYNLKNAAILCLASIVFWDLMSRFCYYTIYSPFFSTPGLT